MHTEGNGWIFYEEFTMASKFRGQYLSVTPLGKSENSLIIHLNSFFSSGYCHLIFKNSGNHYIWKRITTLVNNIIVGKLWIDNVYLLFFSFFLILNYSIYYYYYIGW